MAKKNVTIYHPRRDKPILRPYFAAYGRADADVINIVGSVTNSQGKVIPGSPLLRVPLPNWAVFFEGMQADDYTLEIRETAGGPVLECKRITVTPKFGIGIVHPEVDAQICTNFSAYGDSDYPLTDVNGEKTIVVGGMPYQGVISKQASQASPSWVLWFGAVGEGDDGSLYVKNTNGESDRHNTIHVHNSNCVGGG